MSLVKEITRFAALSHWVGETSISHVARELGVGRSSVKRWLRKDKDIPDAFDASLESYSPEVFVSKENDGSGFIGLAEDKADVTHDVLANGKVFHVNLTFIGLSTPLSLTGLDYNHSPEEGRFATMFTSSQEAVFINEALLETFSMSLLSLKDIEKVCLYQMGLPNGYLLACTRQGMIQAPVTKDVIMGLRSGVIKHPLQDIPFEDIFFFVVDSESAMSLL